MDIKRGRRISSGGYRLNERNVYSDAAKAERPQLTVRQGGGGVHATRTYARQNACPVTLISVNYGEVKSRG